MKAMTNKLLLLTVITWWALAFGIHATVAEKTYTEADDGVKADKEQWQKLEQRLYASWASRDVHYVKTAVPQLRLKNDTVVYAWRGERVGVEAVLFSPVYVRKLSLRTSDWVKDDATFIPAGQCTPRFLRYVLTDEFNTCGTHPSDLEPFLVPDVIDLESSLTIPACTTRPVWLTLEVPRDAEPGEYTLTLDVVASSSQEVMAQRYCREVIYADWNCDSIFDITSSEKVASLGNAKTANTSILNHTFAIRVPATATPGLSLLRICFADAWRDEPLPCGELMKGFAMDIPMQIVDKDTPVEDVQTPQPRWEGGVLRLPWPSRIAVYNSSGALVDMVPETETYSTAGYLPGIYIIEAAAPDGRRLQFKFAIS